MNKCLLISLLGVWILLSPTQSFSKNIKPSAVPKNILSLYKADTNCYDLEKEKLPHPIEFDQLGDHHKLYIIPCSAGAYNVFSKVYISRKGEIEQQFFADYHSDLGWLGSDTLVNAGFDPKTKTLSSFNKSAGFGGCGSSGIWRWREYAFQMIQFQAWDDCLNDKAPEDWPYVYRAKK